MARKKGIAPVEGAKLKAVELFERGKIPSDLEVKALHLSASTRYTYYSQWKSGKLKPSPIKGASKLGTDLGKGEGVGGIDEVKSGGGSRFAIDEVREEAKVKAEEAKVKAESDGNKPAVLPDYIRGEGLEIRTRISVKSLFYYELASTVASDNGSKLSLGDFIDDCIEDFFSGRGLEAGLMREGVKKESKGEPQ